MRQSAKRQAWDIDDAHRAEQLIRNLARRLEREVPGVAANILEGLDEILTVTRLRLPKELRRSLACTNIIENMNGTIRRVCRNVKRWRDASMALRWTAAGMIEAAKGFRRLKAWKQLPALKAALTKQCRWALSVRTRLVFTTWSAMCLRGSRIAIPIVTSILLQMGLALRYPIVVVGSFAEDPGIAPPDDLRSASRGWSTAPSQSSDVGFRVARTL